MQFTQIVDYYLSEEGKKHLPEINRIAKEDTEESDEKLLRYCMEAIRLNGIFGSYRESQTSLSVQDEGRDVQVQPGDKVFVGFVRLPNTSTTLPPLLTATNMRRRRSKQIATQPSSPTRTKSTLTALWIPTSSTVSVRTPASAKRLARSR